MEHGAVERADPDALLGFRRFLGCLLRRLVGSRHVCGLLFFVLVNTMTEDELEIVDTEVGSKTFIT